MNKLKLILLCFPMLLLGITVKGQGLMNRIKQKAANVAERVIDKKVDEAVDGKTGGNASVPTSPGVSSSGSELGTSTNTSTSKSKPTNKGGAGLISTPPNVIENLKSAESAFKTSSLGDTRYAIQQAMLGVELELGQKLLKSFPETVANLPKQADEDQVTSSGWGWTGLTIHREYLKDDKQFEITVTNNAAIMSAMNIFLGNGAFGAAAYGQQTGGQQNWKQTKLKGNKAIIEYDANSGYKLSVPLGQSSLVVFEGINFANEQELMAAAEQVDIDGMKKTLGEQ